MKKFQKDLIKIIIGNIFLSVGYGCITIPNKIVNGGVTSFSLILSNIIPVDVSILVNIFTLTLCALSYWKLGRGNFLKTLISSVNYLVFLNIVRALKIEFIMSPVYVIMIASIFVGLGYYFNISADASTAGFDVVGIMINKKNPKIQIGTVLRCIGVCVLLAGYVSFGPRAVIYGIIFNFVETQVINFMIWSEKKFKEKNIVLDNCVQV